MLWLLITSSLLFLFGLKAYSLLLFCMATLAQCTNEDSNCVYAGKNLWHKIWYQYMHHDDMLCMLWEVWSLMCTSHVARNTQMASLDRQVTQNGIQVINAIARERTMVSSRLPSEAMMRGGVANVDPFLVRWNTLGNGKTANSKSQRQMSKGGSGKRWWFCTRQCGSGGGGWWRSNRP